MRARLPRREAAVLRGHESGVVSAMYSPDADGARVVTASRDGTARLWVKATGAKMASISLDASITAFAFRSEVLALVDGIGRVHVYDLDPSAA